MCHSCSVISAFFLFPSRSDIRLWILDPPAASRSASSRVPWPPSSSLPLVFLWRVFPPCAEGVAMSTHPFQPTEEPAGPALTALQNPHVFRSIPFWLHTTAPTFSSLRSSLPCFALLSVQQQTACVFGPVAWLRSQ